MTNLEIATRADNFVVGVIAAVALVALLAHSQRKDASDDQAARVHAVKQAKAEAQPESWSKLELAAKK